MINIKKQEKIYSGIDRIPKGKAGTNLTKGCLVLEGGGWKGLYTLGVLDAMMELGINFSTVVGVSAGALSGYGYVAGEIGWGARIDLRYRHDPKYCGFGALLRDHGITGFSYLFNDLLLKHPVDKKRLMDPARRLIVSATNMETGKIEYFEKGSCDLQRAIQASASLPLVSRPVMINGVPYMDGACSEKIPMGWARKSGEQKLVVVKTRELGYRRKPGTSKLSQRVYRKYPAFVDSLNKANEEFNETVEELERESEAGTLFLIAPSKPVTVSRFEGDMEKLGDLYWLGYHDLMERAYDLKKFLRKAET